MPNTTVTVANNQTVVSVGGATGAQGATGPKGDPGDVGGISFPTVVVGDYTVDNAISIMNSLNDPTTRIVQLPAGVIYTRQTIVIPTGRTIRGAGENLTEIKAHPTIFADGAFPSMIRSAVDAVAPQVTDLTVNVNKFGQFSGTVRPNGVCMWRAQDFLVQRVTAKNITNYSFWEVSTFGDAARPKGTWRDLTSINSHLDYESTRADGSLWENMKIKVGDGDIGKEAMWHALGGTRNITMRNGRAEPGSYTGYVLEILLNENEDVFNITMQDLHGSTASDSYGLYISSTYRDGGAPAYRRPLTGIKIKGCTIGKTFVGGGPGIAIDNSNVEIIDTAFDFTTGEAATVTENSLIKISGNTNLTLAAGGSISTFFSEPDLTSQVRWTGCGFIWFKSGSPQTATSRNIRMSSDIRILGPDGTDLQGASPIGIGQKIRRCTTANSPNNTIIGSGAFQYGVATDATYRIRVVGEVQPTVNGDTVYVGPVGYPSNGTITLTGLAKMAESNGDGFGTSATEKKVVLTSATESGANSLVGVPIPLTTDRLPFTLDYTVVAAGYWNIQHLVYGSGKVLPGAIMEIERVA